MLWRNAALRLLTRDGVRVEAAEVALAEQIAYGEKYRCRLILVPSEREAGEILGILGPQPSGADFGRLASRHSVDPSAVRGGELPLISPVDPAYPLAVRSALSRLSPGGVSSILPLPAGAAVVYLESVVLGSPPPENARSMLEAELRVQRERDAMEGLARQIIGNTRVDVLDRSLGWSWDRGG
jgi:parvulin-like peptidyl-prolyl isomerase